MNKSEKISFYYIKIDEKNGKRYTYLCDYDPEGKKATVSGPIDAGIEPQPGFSVYAKSLYDARKKITQQLG